MDARTAQRQRTPLPARLRRVRWVRAGLAIAVVALLVSGLAGGLLRAGVGLPTPPVFVAAIGLHGALMMGGFFGTVVGLERAVALKHPAGFLAPLASLAGAWALLAGQGRLGAALGLCAALAFVAVNVRIVQRQVALHTGLLLLGALAWLAAQGLFSWCGAVSPAAIAGWAAFLVLTVAAERLEMTRLMRRRPGAQASLQAIVALLLIGGPATAVSPAVGGALFGTALGMLALWLLRFDIAWRTVRTQGLSRYMAVCLLCGHAWLLLAGVAWGLQAWGWPGRDVALHALGLGFLFGMVMGHAPVILPALTRLKVYYTPWFYAPLALLQASLLLRFLASTPFAGAVGNAAALALFAATLIGAAVAWHRVHRLPQRAARSHPSRSAPS